MTLYFDIFFSVMLIKLSNNTIHVNYQEVIAHYVSAIEKIELTAIIKRKSSVSKHTASLVNQFYESGFPNILINITSKLKQIR